MLRALPCLLLLLPFLAAQQAEPKVLQRVLPMDWHRPETNLQVEQSEGRIRRVTWQSPGKAGPPVVIPLNNPVTDLEAALLPSGDALVLLAGGVREGESLDLYVADRVRVGRMYVFESKGGSRLRQAFAAGLGSWPVVDENDLLLFAYLRQGRIEFRAVDLSWSDPHREIASLLVQRPLPATGGNGEEVKGFTAVSDLGSNRVRVTFDGAGEPIDFAHPLAPRAQLRQTLLEFGAEVIGGSSERVLQVDNTGKRTLQLSLAVHPPFHLVGTDVRSVEPGAQASIRIRFQPDAALAFQERLHLTSNSSSPTLAVPLRGVGVDPAAPAVAVQPPKVPPANAPLPENPPAVQPPLKVVSAPTVLSCAAVRIEPEAEDNVRVTGIANVAGPGIDLVVRSSSGAEVHTTADAVGAFQVSLVAAAGDLVLVTAVGEDGTRSQTLELGSVLPWLQRDHRYLELRGQAGKSFLLFAVVLAADGVTIERVEQLWRGDLGNLGIRRISLEALGATPPLAVVAVVDPVVHPRRSNVVSLR